MLLFCGYNRLSNCRSLQHIQAINPDGRSFASGAEDGYIRLHFFDKSYLDMKDPVPEEEDEPVEEEDDDDEEGGDGKPAAE